MKCLHIGTTRNILRLGSRIFKNARGLARLLLCLLFVIAFAGCTFANNTNQSAESVTGSNVVLGDSETIPAINESQALYMMYRQQIDEGLGTFRALNNQNEEMGPLSTLKVEERIIWGISAEGATLTRFITPEGAVVRYTIFVYGESGKAENNYYYFENGLSYIQLLRMTYSDFGFGAENRFDILEYELTSFVQDGEQIYLLDNERQEAIEWLEEDLPFRQFEELNTLFDGGELVKE